MSDLIVVAFKGEYQADEVLLTLRKMQREQLVDLEDSCVVRRNQDGKLKLSQAHNLVLAGASGGGFWGLLIGLLFLHPLAGILVGAAAGAAGGALSDVGINDDFIKEVGSTITPDSSALFILVRKATPDKVLEELRPFEGRVLRSSLTHEDESKLQVALSHGA
jgi:uncharacterized membrane protein